MFVSIFAYSLTAAFVSVSLSPNACILQEQSYTGDYAKNSLGVVSYPLIVYESN